MTEQKKKKYLILGSLDADDSSSTHNSFDLIIPGE